ncbi:DsrE/DsrF/DrsH-like family protein [Methanohalophilus portucalensis]|uniref:Predicted peroxiredoxin n=2 Tax=Methanohalophilus portucalensis FDF-1 TaxID=523843 RepID=A0A1X7NC50_9EURY|nr:Predicted peroxiredoxin [Methanohalophilus portucalensis FDF-1]
MRDNIHKVTNVLILLKSMIYESTGPLETLRFAKHYSEQGLNVNIVLFGPMGVMLAKKDKAGALEYDQKIDECMNLGVNFMCCKLGSSLVGLKYEEMIPGIEMVEPEAIADTILEFSQKQQLIITL